MFIEAKAITKNAVIRADICIIGSGAAGIPMAISLLSSGKKICILESGGRAKPEGDDAFYDFETTGLPISRASRVRVYGGTTTAWTGRWKPHDEIDFENWPIKFKDLAPYYDQAATLVNATPLDKLRVTEETLVRNSVRLHNETINTTLFGWLPERDWDWGKKFAAKFESTDNPKVYLGAYVTKLQASDNRAEILAAEVKTTDGNSFSVRAQVFVLAAGGIETPRLLLHSKIGNDHDQVGRYYMDHPKGKAGKVKLARPLNMPLYWNFNDEIIGGVALAPEVIRREKLLNSYVLLQPEFSQSLPWRIYRKLTSRPGPVQVIHLRNFMEQLPLPDNRVTLSNKKDIFGSPLPAINWQIDERSKFSLRTLHKILAEQFERLGVGKLDSPLLSGQDNPWPVATDASHHMGATRMGSDRSRSVVNKNCQVHGIANLFIAGPSVFTTGGYANPTATIAALSLRLADHLIDTYR